jgi:hypothetical protein
MMHQFQSRKTSSRHGAYLDDCDFSFSSLSSSTVNSTGFPTPNFNDSVISFEDNLRASIESRSFDDMSYGSVIAKNDENSDHMQSDIGTKAQSIDSENGGKSPDDRKSRSNEKNSFLSRKNVYQKILRPDLSRNTSVESTGDISWLDQSLLPFEQRDEEDDDNISLDSPDKIKDLHRRYYTNSSTGSIFR